MLRKNEYGDQLPIGWVLENYKYLFFFDGIILRQKNVLSKQILHQGESEFSDGIFSIVLLLFVYL